jgi:hypothetical protein
LSQIHRKQRKEIETSPSSYLSLAQGQNSGLKNTSTARQEKKNQKNYFSVETNLDDTLFLHKNDDKVNQNKFVK